MGSIGTLALAAKVCDDVSLLVNIWGVYRRMAPRPSARRLLQAVLVVFKSEEESAEDRRERVARDARRRRRRAASASRSRSRSVERGGRTTTTRPSSTPRRRGGPRAFPRPRARRRGRRGVARPPGPRPSSSSRCGRRRRTRWSGAPCRRDGAAAPGGAAGLADGWRVAAVLAAAERRLLPAALGVAAALRLRDLAARRTEAARGRVPRLLRRGAPAACACVACGRLATYALFGPPARRKRSAFAAAAPARARPHGAARPTPPAEGGLGRARPSLYAVVASGLRRGRVIRGADFFGAIDAR
ncbi:hypothetical protein JL720_994 [Aureococcus anophagefferens]|nr:hypothetical protein JL720_994 [Aureococcus anophagefferens]